METMQFKTESKRVLGLMINSIYTNKDVFLRELISNASDALDKLSFAAMTGDAPDVTREDLAIQLAVDKTARTLTVSDNGCGMTREELIDNLGTIAKSGTFDFKTTQEADVDVIGQFGVGFYSAFMVSRQIEVVSRAYGSDQAHRWQSTGEDGFTIDPCQRDSHGTTVIVHIAPDTEDEKFGKYLEFYSISALVKKYSDYIRFPIKMDTERSRAKEDQPGEYETYTVNETLNSMVPIWRKRKDELTSEAYNNFYRDKFFDFADPIRVIHTKVEGRVTYTALLYIPANPPYNYYTKGFEKGLQLYSNGVMIMENCAALLPDHFGFVRGVVESEDFSLNISRELLQHDRQLKLISKNIDKSIRTELSKMLADDREAYESFFKAFAVPIKYGLYDGYGANKADLQDLVLFHSLKENKLITLKEYVTGMSEGQKYIYYACGETADKVTALPQVDALQEKGYDVLCFTDEVDEFAITVMREYEGKEYKSASSADLGLVTEEEKQELQQKADSNKPLLDCMQEALSGQVKAVRLSTRLTKHPVCLVSDSEISVEMEKVLNTLPSGNPPVKAERVLEINAQHPVFVALTALADQPEKVRAYAQLLYDQALLIAGIPIEDPVAFSNAVCNLMVK